MGKAQLAASAMPPRYAALLAGDIKIEELDDEEIARGRLRASDGTFGGRPPVILPEQVRQMFKRELIRRMQGRFEDMAFEAIERMGITMKDGEGSSESETEAGVTRTYKEGTGQAKAAQYIIERVMGPIPKEVTVKTEASPWEMVTQGGGLVVDIEPEEVTVEAEVVPEPRRRGRRVKRHSVREAREQASEES